MGFDLLPATVDELWAIHDYVRQHDKLGQEWDRDFTTRVMAAIQDASASPDQAATVMCLEEDLWQIDRQIPSGLMVGTQPVGKTLLTKVMGLLVKMRGGMEDAADNTDAGAYTSEDADGGTYSAASSR